MIKNPFNFWIGIFFGMCFAAGIAMHRDAFSLSVCAVATVTNLAIGLTG